MTERSGSTGSEAAVSISFLQDVIHCGIRTRELSSDSRYHHEQETCCKRLSLPDTFDYIFTDVEIIQIAVSVCVPRDNFILTDVKRFSNVQIVYSFDPYFPMFLLFLCILITIITTPFRVLYR